MSESFILSRSGRAPLRFTGELVSESEGRRLLGKEQSRWHDVSIYTTDNNLWVLCITYRSQYQGEPGHNHAEWFASAVELAGALSAYDPCRHVGGWPTGEHYRERQGRLLADIRRCFAAQVSEVLASDPAFAEDLDAEETTTGEFRCPQCGGWAFGYDLDAGVYQCNSDCGGVPLSEGNSNQPCNWNGPEPAAKPLVVKE